MDFYVINGSPRKKYNTSKVLDALVEGAYDQLEDRQYDDEINIEIIDLYDLDYKGCKSCFHCKKIDGKFYGQCPINDDLLELLPKLWASDAIVMASPIYFGNVTGQMRSFLERLIFPKYVYGADSLAKKKTTACIYTMNVDKDMGEKLYGESVFNLIERFIEYSFGKTHSFKVYDTYQFKDYSLYENYMFDEEKKRKTRDEQFPKDLKEAYMLGRTLVSEILDNES